MITHTATESKSIIAFRNVSHRFGQFQALRDLSFTLQRGDLYGLLGLNGAGKTTTLRILLGLLRQQSGEVEVFGKSLASDPMYAAERIGATIENPAFYPHLSGLTNLRLLHGLMPRRAGDRTPEEALAATGLTTAANIKVRKYSMGMTQRLYLAQALLCRPELLVLDEPISNLDPQGIMEVRKLIQKLNREEGLTVLLSSHQLTEVEGLCNRVAIINRGRMILETDVAELFDTEESWIDIQVSRSEEALQLIARLDWCMDATRTGEDALRVRTRSNRRGELNSLLVTQGFVVEEFTRRRPTLEDYFHRRIAEDAA